MDGLHGVFVMLAQRRNRGYLYSWSLGSGLYSRLVFVIFLVIKLLKVIDSYRNLRFSAIRRLLFENQDSFVHVKSGPSRHSVKRKHERWCSEHITTRTGTIEVDSSTWKKTYGDLLSLLHFRCQLTQFGQTRPTKFCVRSLTEV